MMAATTTITLSNLAAGTWQIRASNTANVQPTIGMSWTAELILVSNSTANALPSQTAAKLLSISPVQPSALQPFNNALPNCSIWTQCAFPPYASL